MEYEGGTIVAIVKKKSVSLKWRERDRENNKDILGIILSTLVYLVTHPKTVLVHYPLNYRESLGSCQTCHWRRHVSKLTEEKTEARL